MSSVSEKLRQSMEKRKKKSVATWDTDMVQMCTKPGHIGTVGLGEDQTGRTN